MSIQSISGISAYGAANNSTWRQAKSSAAVSSSSAASPAATDQVTLSDTAQQLVASDNGTTQHRTRVQQQYLQAALSDPASAGKLARDMALSNSTIFYNIRDVPFDKAGTMLSSGKIIDENFKKNFYAKAPTIDAGRKQVYDSEIAKGTDPVEIIAKMLDFTNSQSRDYLEAAAQLDRGAAQFS